MVRLALSQTQTHNPTKIFHEADTAPELGTEGVLSSSVLVTSLTKTTAQGPF